MKHLINLSKKAFSSSFKVVNPYSQTVHREYHYKTPEDIKITMDRALTGSQYLKGLSLEERISLCKEAMDWFETNKDRVAKEITLSMGKPLRESYNELKVLKVRTEAVLGLAKDELADETVEVDDNRLKKIVKEPIGTGLIISPWNYPLLVTMNPLLYGVMAGNSMVIKHSVRTPLIGDLFEDAFQAAGANNVVQHCLCEDSDIKLFYNYDQLNFVGFTGSVEGGRAVAAEVAQSNRFINTIYELGGKDPAYIRPDCDLDAAAAAMVEGSMYNAGQSCVAVERCYVHADIYEEFIGKCITHAEKLQTGDPMSEETTLGPLTVPDTIIKLTSQIEQATEMGANLLLGGKVDYNQEGKTVFFTPTILSNCTNDMKIVRDESFGPVLPIIKVLDDDEAVNLMNDSPFGLTASIYTKDSAAAEKIGAKLNVGTVFMNMCDYPDPLLTHTGRKNSGNGCSLSRHGFTPFYKLKSYNFKNE